MGKDLGPLTPGIRGGEFQGPDPWWGSTHKIPRIRPPFDAQKLMPKIGGSLICEDLTFCVKVKSRNEQVFSSIKREWDEFLKREY